MNIAAFVATASLLHLSPNGGADMTKPLMDAIAELNGKGGGELSLAPGEYHFRTPSRRGWYVSNHDNPLPRNVFLPLEGLTNVTIRSPRAELVFHGEGMAMGIVDSANVVLKGLAFDYSRPFNTEWRFMGFEDGEPILETDPDKFPFSTEGGKLFTAGENLHVEEVVAEMFGGRNYETVGKDWVGSACELISPGRIRLKAPLGGYRFVLPPEPGKSVFVMRARKRPNPAMFLYRTEDVLLEDVIFRSSAGMGLIAQRSADITMRGTGKAADRTCGTFSRADSGRKTTLLADATHFSCCRGQITVENCTFERMMDDAINVHAVGLRVERIVPPSRLVCRFKHPQALGFEVFAPGETLRFIKTKTLENGAEAKIASVRAPSPDVVEIELACRVPDGCAEGDTVENADWQPSVRFAGNMVDRTVARGALFTTSGKVTCESNLFSHIYGSAIKVSGDSMNWYETGGCRDLAIRGNRFENCRTAYGAGVIAIDPEIADVARQRERYHRGIVIEDNVFETHDVPLVWANSVKGLVWRRNRIVRNNLYRALHRAPLHFENSEDVSVDGVPAGKHPETTVVPDETLMLLVSGVDEVARMERDLVELSEERGVPLWFGNPHGMLNAALRDGRWRMLLLDEDEATPEKLADIRGRAAPYVEIVIQTRKTDASKWPGLRTVHVGNADGRRQAEIVANALFPRAAFVPIAEKPLRVLAVGARVSEVTCAYIGRIAQEKGRAVEVVSRDVTDWRQARGPWDVVMLVPPSEALKTRAGIFAWGDGLLADLRKAVPNALFLCRQPFSWNVDDIAAYDELSLNCMHFTIRHDLGTMPAGFAWQCYVQERDAKIADYARMAEYLDACVWVEKLCEVNVRELAFRPNCDWDHDDLALARRCAVEAVRIFSPVPVRNCALEAIGRMTPMPVDADWWKKRLADKRKEIAALNGEVDLVFVGSSQIHIWETRCPLLLRDIQRDFTLLNLGYSGDSFQKVCWRLTKGHEMDGYKAKCIMLVQGGNNTSEVPSALALGMKQILDVFAVKQPQAKVLLLPINPRREWDCGTAPRPRPGVDAANAMLRHYADGKNVFWVDFREELYDDNDDTAWCMPGDRLHLGTEGLKIWYSHVSPLFHRICGKPVPPETEGWIDRTPERRTYVPNRFCWAARFEKRGGFVLEKIDGAEGKVDFTGDRITIHKTNTRGALVLKAHPFASHTNMPVRLYADVEVLSSEHARSVGYLAAEGFGPSEPEQELAARPEGCRVRRYCHVTSTNGDLRPTIVVAGAPSKTRWTNWRAEDLYNPRRRNLREPVPKISAPRPMAKLTPPREIAVVTGTLYDNARRQLRILEGASMAYSRYEIADVVRDPSQLEASRLVVFLGVRTFDASTVALVKSLSAPARTLVYLDGTGLDGDFTAATGLEIKSLGKACVPYVKPESVRWPDLETGVYGLSTPALVSPVMNDRAVSFAHYGADKDAKSIVLRRDAKSCRHIYVAAPCGLTPEYFNRLARESNVKVPTDETGLRVAWAGKSLEIECYRTGRYDFRLPNAGRVVNDRNGKEEPVRNGELKLNLVAGGIYRFEVSAEK